MTLSLVRHSMGISFTHPVQIPISCMILSLSRTTFCPRELNINVWRTNPTATGKVRIRQPASETLSKPQIGRLAHIVHTNMVKRCGFQMNGRTIRTKSSETSISSLNSMPIVAAFTGKDNPIKPSILQSMFRNLDGHPILPVVRVN